MGCRLERSRQWALRCVHEASLHKENSFITLTYADDQLPKDKSLDKAHLQRFFKRLRKRFPSKPFRYYACGEYGDNTKRAHYHACLFGMDFDDKVHFRTFGENRLYLSEELTQVWGHGNTSTGDVTFESAAYCARYITKKQLGSSGGTYQVLDQDSGELHQVVQPFAVMSLKPAIAKTWIHRYHSDIYKPGKDFITVRGRRAKPARYYDKQLQAINESTYALIKENRKLNLAKLSSQELRAREINTRARLTAKRQI